MGAGGKTPDPAGRPAGPSPVLAGLLSAVLGLLSLVVDGDLGRLCAAGALVCAMGLVLMLWRATGAGEDRAG
ncbi:hypothetical protein [Catenuloplanes japonicus]|uniref:hypothetical protein n=1 Tax=Catenuloplanes japonicus TaxID=33876 RepID=UPI0012F86E0C|nr:hypothetical protein [Catenuloplanes japonicus]